MSDELKGTTVSEGAGMSPAEAVEYWYQRWETAYDRCISLETSLDAARAEIARLSDSVAEGLTKTKLDELIAEVVAARGRWYFIEPYEAGAVALRDAILALTQQETE
jgi:hypothetical protein